VNEEMFAQETLLSVLTLGAETEAINTDHEGNFLESTIACNRIRDALDQKKALELDDAKWSLSIAPFSSLLAGK
jgi:hypothetical protein